MIIPILIVVAVLLLMLGGGAAVWFVSRQRKVLRGREPVRQSTPAPALVFHWGYIVLPLFILLLSIIITVYFYPRLPDAVAYHFAADGSADRWLGRSVIIVWLLLPQFILTLLAGAITWGVTSLGSRFRQPERPVVKVESVLLLMGNMIVLPQIILCFAMLDIFSYNSYQVHLLPLWAVALIVMVLGGIILGVFFIQAIRQAWEASR